MSDNTNGAEAQEQTGEMEVQKGKSSKQESRVGAAGACHAPFAYDGGSNDVRRCRFVGHLSLGLGLPYAFNQGPSERPVLIPFRLSSLPSSFLSALFIGHDSLDTWPCVLPSWAYPLSRIVDELLETRL